MTLTQAALRKILHYNRQTGEFTWRVRTSIRVQVGDIAGCRSKSTGYVFIRILGKLYAAHRLAWFYVKGAWPPCLIDHENRVRHDNRWRNLQLATYSENQQNQLEPSRRNTSGVVGVSWDSSRGQWLVQLRVNNRKVHHTRHDKLKEAIAVRRAAEVRFQPRRPQR